MVSTSHLRRLSAQKSIDTFSSLFVFLQRYLRDLEPGSKNCKSNFSGASLASCPWLLWPSSLAQTSTFSWGLSGRKKVKRGSQNIWCPLLSISSESVYSRAEPQTQKLPNFEITLDTTGSIHKKTRGNKFHAKKIVFYKRSVKKIWTFLTAFAIKHRAPPLICYWH